MRLMKHSNVRHVSTAQPRWPLDRIFRGTRRTDLLDANGMQPDCLRSALHDFVQTL